MKNFFKQWFGGSKSAPAHSQPAHSRSPWDNPLTIEDGSENATRRQLVQVLMRDVLRKSGIPPQWIDCQMLLVSSRTRGQGMYVRLVIKHWDKRLMNYAFAFQQALLADIRHFEPRAEEWLHGISWQFEVEDSCPYTVLPGRTYWQEQHKHNVAEEPASPFPAAVVGSPGLPGQAFESTQPDPASDPAHDLERLFAIRDRELARQAAERVTPVVGYEKTQPSSLL
ncbi:hypothetical protein [Polaromonas sp.]|uniref:hypothetical protein n=1 Tax=Polaromonas sp. TaxID=1869339 RepID=UPI003BAABD08